MAVGEIRKMVIGKSNSWESKITFHSIMRRPAHLENASSVPHLLLRVMTEKESRRILACMSNRSKKPPAAFVYLSIVIKSTKYRMGNFVIARISPKNVRHAEQERFAPQAGK